MCEPMSLSKCISCIRHSCARNPTDIHKWQSKQKRAYSLSIRSEFFTIFKISLELIYSQVKFDEELVGVIGELVWEIILELGPNFWSKLFPEPPKVTQWQIRIEQMFAHTYTFVRHSSQLSIDVRSFTANPVNIGELRTDMTERFCSC